MIEKTKMKARFEVLAAVSDALIGKPVECKVEISILSDSKCEYEPGKPEYFCTPMNVWLPGRIVDVREGSTSEPKDLQIQVHLQVCCSSPRVWLNASEVTSVGDTNIIKAVIDELGLEKEGESENAIEEQRVA